MADIDIIFVDTNTNWHWSLAEALAKKVRVVGISPRRGAVWSGTDRSLPKLGEFTVNEVRLPPGWASHTSVISQRLLLTHIRSVARSLSNPIVVLTSPAYAPIARWISTELPVVTYTADDFSSYQGWHDARGRERKMQSHAALCVFVSEALRERAVLEDGVPRDQTFVSPNATEPRFGYSTESELPVLLKTSELPILGILGGVSDRLDLDFVRGALNLSTYGTFLIAGPVSDDARLRIPELASNKVIISGRILHSEMHLYAKAMDAAIVPYASTRLNYFCSPLRLFDHLASGVHVYALPTCAQICRMKAPGLTVDQSKPLLEKLSAGLPRNKVDRSNLPLFWDDRASALIEAIGLQLKAGA